jgi:hypothetical protein
MPQRREYPALLRGPFRLGLPLVRVIRQDRVPSTEEYCPQADIFLSHGRRIARRVLRSGRRPNRRALAQYARMGQPSRPARQFTRRIGVRAHSPDGTPVSTCWDRPLLHQVDLLLRPQRDSTGADHAEYPGLRPDVGAIRARAKLQRPAGRAGRRRGCFRSSGRVRRPAPGGAAIRAFFRRRSRRSFSAREK